MNIVYRWTQTPAELYACFRPSHTRANSVTLEGLPFKVAKKPLDGTPYTYQLALSATSNAADIAPIHKAHPEIPVSGDDRAGVIVFHGTMIIGSYITPGQQVNNMRRVVIHEKYRGQGLGTRMLEQWFRETPGCVDVPQQPINVHAVKTFLDAHERAVTWASSNGKQVPQRVRDAIASGTERAAIIASTTPVENAHHHVFRRRI